MEIDYGMKYINDGTKNLIIMNESSKKNIKPQLKSKISFQSQVGNFKLTIMVMDCNKC
jgi:hypothetical protein